MSENTNKPGYQPQPVPETSQQGSSSLLTSNTLVVQQTRSFMSNDFEMQSQDGRVLGRVLTTGSTAGRLLKGNRTFDLVDDRGNLIIKIVDPFDFGLDRYELQNPDGSVFAHVQKQFSFMRKRLTIELPGLTLELEGSLFEYDFNITVNGHVAARVAREWGGLVAGLRGKSRYGVNFDPSAPEPVRLAILGGLVALDLIRAKDARN